MANRYWVGGNGTWNASNTTNWSASDGGTGGASIPTSSDSVFFTNLSSTANAAYTVTLGASQPCLDFNMAGPGASNAVTFAGAQTLNIYGNFSITGSATEVLWTHTGTISFQSTLTTDKTIASNGVVLPKILLADTNGKRMLSDNLTLNGSSAFQINGGIFDPNGKKVKLTNTLATITSNVPVTFYDLEIAPATPSKGSYFSIGTYKITVTNTLTINGGTNQYDRVLVQSVTPGLECEISAGITAINNTDFRLVRASGAAGWDLSSATGYSGDCGGNTGITFTTPSDQHFTNVNGGTWSTVANWTSRIPLPQDNVIIDTAFGTSKTITLDVPRAGKDIDFSGATWTTGLTLSVSLGSTVSLYGSIKLKTGMTVSGSDTVSPSGLSSHTIDTQGVTMPANMNVNINTPSGTYSLANHYTSLSAFVVNAGTFKTLTYNLTCTAFSASLSSTYIAITLDFGSGTHTMTAASTAFNVSNTSKYVTVIPGTSSIKFTDSTNSTLTFNCVKKLYNVSFERGTSTGQIAISNGFVCNSFQDIGTAAHTITLPSTACMFNSFSVSGTSGNVKTLSGAGATTPSHLLCKSGTITLDYVTVTNLVVGGGATWNLGTGATVSTGNYFGTGFGFANATDAQKKRYWVPGGTGNWNSTTNWSTSSGGASGASVPVGESVYFDANSGSGTSTINASSTCGNLDCTGFTGTLAGSSQIQVYGSFKLSSGMTYSHTGAVYFYRSGSSKTIDMSGKTKTSGVMYFNGIDDMNLNIPYENGFGDTYTLSSDINTIDATGISHLSGTINANGYNVNAMAFSHTQAGYPRMLYMGSGTWDMNGSSSPWSYFGSFTFVYPQTSTLKFSDKTSTTSRNVFFGDYELNNLWFDCSAPISINPSTTGTCLKCKDFRCDLLGSQFTFSPGMWVYFNTFSIPSTVGKKTSLQCSSTGNYVYFVPRNGSFSINGVILTGIYVIGTGFAGNNSGPNSLFDSKNIILSTPSSVVSGVVSNSGSPVSGAIVKLIRQEDDYIIGETTTNGSGVYSFYADPSKKYHVAVEYENGGTKYNAKSLWDVTPA
jgi:hypothetical protein